MKPRTPQTDRNQEAPKAAKPEAPSARTQSNPSPEKRAELRALRKELADKIAELRPSPLHNSRFASAIDYPVEEDDQSED